VLGLEGEKEPPAIIQIIFLSWRGSLYVVFCRQAILCRSVPGGRCRLVPSDDVGGAGYYIFVKAKNTQDEQRGKERGTVCGARESCCPEVEFVGIPTCAAA
jgi:hypothetical protein